MNLGDRGVWTNSCDDEPLLQCYVYWKKHRIFFALATSGKIPIFSSKVHRPSNTTQAFQVVQHPLKENISATNKRKKEIWMEC
jgi:hypothetical protein